MSKVSLNRRHNTCNVVFITVSSRQWFSLNNFVGFTLPVFIICRRLNLTFKTLIKHICISARLQKYKLTGEQGTNVLTFSVCFHISIMYDVPGRELTGVSLLCSVFP